MITRMPARVLSIAVLLSGVAGAASPQSRRPGERDGVVLGLSVDSAAEANGRQDGLDLRDPQFQGIRVTSGVQASLTYDELHRERVGWQFTAATGATHYADLHETLPSGQTAGVVLALAPGRRTRVNINESVSYLPNYSLAPLLAPAAGLAGSDIHPTGDHAIVRTPSYTMASTITLTQDLTRRTALMLTYGAQRREFIDDGGPDMSSSNLAGRFIYRLTKSAGIHAGYGRRLADYSAETAARQAHIDDIDVGIDYSRALAVARRTTLNFSSGSAVTSDAINRRYSVTGAARLDRAIGRTGHLGLTVERSVRLVEGFAEPLFADTITATAGGRMTSRIGVGTSVGYARGAVGTGAESNGLRSINGAARVVVAMTRGSGLWAEYGYSQHTFADAVALLAHMPSAQQRQTLHVGIAVQLPLVRQQVRERK